MNADEGDPYTPEIQDEYKEILRREGINQEKIEYLGRLDFYRRADEAYCMVATGERARYANVILKKGIFESDE
jgi:L-fucose mutarotase